MGTLIFSFVLLTFVYCTAHAGLIPDGAKDQLFKIYKNVALEVRNIKYDPITEDKVKYFLFKKEHPSEYIALDPYRLERFENVTCTVAILIHGWTNDREVQWYEDVKNALLNRDEEYCVIQVDWKEPASHLYTVSSISTYDVAKFIAKFVVDLHQNCSIPLEKFLIIGHSLGGQISGFVGKRVEKAVGEKLPRIIALDPAGPLFTQRPEDKRLNSNDAKIVEVIHSDGDVFGYKSAIGTIDFYPNGGNTQPGCSQVDLADPKSIINDPVSCDHRRAYEYFAEAVLNPSSFLAKKCEDWKQFENDKCEKEQVTLGNITTTLTGKFYLETNKNRPFSKKLRGESVLNVSKLLKRN